MTMLSEKERFEKTVAGDAILVTTIAKVVRDQYGEEGLEAVRRGIGETYRKIIRSVARQVGVRVGDGDAQDWMKLESHLGAISDMDLEITGDANQCTIRVSRCPLADHYKRIYPDYCRDVLIGLEYVIAETINPRLAVKGNKYMPSGDDICEIVCEMKQEE